MRQGRASKKRIIITAAVAVVLIAAFGLIMYLIEQHGLLDEQFGDTGSWGSGDDLQIELADTLYTTDDSVDTYLLMGIDGGGDDKGEGYNGELADYLVMLIVDNTTKKYAFLEMDRNSMVDMRVPNYRGGSDEYAVQQLCISHWYGRDAEERNENTLEAVSTLLGGLEAKNYYVLNMADIGKVNNAIGGVTVKIDQDMTNVDPAFTEGATVKLDDEQAERFVRARMNVGDGTNKARMGRQNQFMQNAFDMVYGQLTEDPEYINELAEKLDGVIATGDNPDKTSKLSNQLVKYENLGTLHITGESKLGETQGDGKEYEEFYADEASIAECLGKVIDLQEDTEEE